jgi:lipoate---protein ligase
LLKKAYNTYKAEKLIKILLEYEEEDHHQENVRTINSIRITGDFFLYPEDSLEDLELQLKGTRLDKPKLKEKIDACLSNSEAFGFDSESMSDAIMGCLSTKRC